MKKFTKVFIIAIIVLLILIIITLAYRVYEDTWICTSSGWMKHGNPSAPMPTEGCETVKSNSSNESIKAIET